MKSFVPYSLLLAAAASGVALGQTTAYTTPVGYETLPVSAGINFLGVRLHQPVVAAGKLTAVSSSSLTDSSASFSTAVNTGTTYILEVANANGVTQELLGSSISGNVITTSSDLSSKVAIGDSYKIRKAPTLATTFGAANEAGLQTGFYGPDGDIVLLPNPNTEGGFDQYYYDAGYESWADASGTPVDGASIAWNYVDGVVISATGGGLASLTVSGEIKAGSTNINLAANAVNFISTASPVGATLASSFGDSLASIDQGFYGPDGDIFLVPNPLTDGGFDQYYYDGGYESWADGSGTPVDGTSVSLTSGIVIFNANDSADVVNHSPVAYASL